MTLLTIEELREKYIDNLNQKIAEWWYFGIESLLITILSFILLIDSINKEDFSYWFLVIFIIFLTILIYNLLQIKSINQLIRDYERR